MSDLSPSEQLLAKQYTQLTALETIIVEEKSILQQHDPEALLKITADKNQLLIDIQTLDQHISINQQFAQDKAAGLLTKPLSEIATLLESCQTQNQVNGMIIQQSQLAVERMKTSLLENHSRSSITYNNKGKKSGGLSSIGIKA